MSDFDDISSKAALTAGKQAAKRAMEDLLSTDEERAEREAEEAATRKRRRTKLIAFGVVGLLLVIGIFGMVVSYWQWFLLLGVLGVAGLYGWYRLRKRLAAKKEEEPAALRVAEPELAATPAKKEPERREEAMREAMARREAAAAEEQEIEDELAAMKARLDERS